MSPSISPLAQSARHRALKDADPQNLLHFNLPPGADIPCCGLLMESCRPDVEELSALV